MHVRIQEKPLMRNAFFSFCAGCLLLLSGCSEKLEDFDGYNYQPERLQELLPLQAGKYITYHLDSTVFTGLGLVREVHSYQEKNVVDAQVTDASGQPSYRVYRYLRDADGTQPWRAAGTYFITNTGNRVEWVENNRRVVKLVLPVQEGTTWRGFQYLPNEPFSPEINDFSVGNGLKTWEFTYGDEITENLGGTEWQGVRTVLHIDEITNLDAAEKPINENGYASKTYSVDKYAKGLGLVYQNFTLWEYQPVAPGSSVSYKGTYKGFGVERTIIDHN